VVRALTALLALSAIGLTACGGDDKAQVDQTVRDFVKATNERDTKKFCDQLVSQQFLEQSTGAKGSKARDACHQQLKSLKGLKVKLEKISSTKVEGDKATVRAVLSSQGQKQDQVLRLKKEGGDWKLAGGSGG
jgi:ketosteroid isomerase-like protein